MLALLDDYAPAGLEETADVWTVFFQSVDTRQAALSAIVLALGGDGVTAEARDIPDEAWAERSQADLRAIRVGRLTIAPPWDLPARPTDDTIVITPSFGFGTGHHASTRLALEAIQQVPFRGRSVLDLGSGSGVVAIAARRLGAASVVAVEVDPMAAEAAARNFCANGMTDDIRSSSATSGPRVSPTPTSWSPTSPARFFVGRPSCWPGSPARAARS